MHCIHCEEPQLSPQQCSKLLLLSTTFTSFTSCHFKSIASTKPSNTYEPQAYDAVKSGLRDGKNPVLAARMSKTCGEETERESEGFERKEVERSRRRHQRFLAESDSSSSWQNRTAAVLGIIEQQRFVAESDSNCSWQNRKAAVLGKSDSSAS